MFWQSATSVIAGSFAGLTCKNKIRTCYRQNYYYYYYYYYYHHHDLLYVGYLYLYSLDNLCP